MTDSVPPETFVEPMTPPLSPALMAAISRAVEEGFGPISEAWGNAFVAQREFTERVEEKADNALRKLEDRDRAHANYMIAIDAKLAELLRRLGTHEKTPLDHAHPPNGK